MAFGVRCRGHLFKVPMSITPVSSGRALARMAETGSLLRGAAAPLLALLAWLRGSRQREAAAEAEAAAEVEAAALFAAHVRRECASSTSPCVLDVCAKDILNYPQGAFALIEDDLARAPPDIDSAASIRVLRQACQLPQVFAHRKDCCTVKACGRESAQALLLRRIARLTALGGVGASGSASPLSAQPPPQAVETATGRLHDLPMPAPSATHSGAGQLQEGLPPPLP